MRSARLLFFGLILLVSACGTAASATSNTASLEVAIKLPVVALPGYEVSVFTQNDSRLLVSNPDSIAVDGHRVFIHYHNLTPKHSSAHAPTVSPTPTAPASYPQPQILHH